MAATRELPAPVTPAAAARPERRAPGPEGAGRRRALSVLETVGAGLAIALLAWRPLGSQAPAPGLDPSWAGALHMALHQGIGFGNHLAFTYGPLGFLNVNGLWYADTGIAAFIYRFAVRLAVATALFVAARRSYGNVGGALVALVVAAVDDQFIEPVAFFILVVLLVDRHANRPATDASERSLRITLVVAGALAGLSLLGPISSGLNMAALAVIAALAIPGRRRTRLLAVLAGLVGALLIGWIATGQSVGALPDYVRNSASIVSGYSQAMSVESPGLGLEYAAAWVALALGLVAAAQMRRSTSRSGLWIGLLWLTFWFFMFKEGFVRHDAGHGTVFFTAVAGAFVAFTWVRGNRLKGLAMTGAMVAMALAASKAPFSDAGPGTSIRGVVDDVANVFDASKRQAATEQGRQAIEAAFPLDPASLALLRGHTVHVAPYEATVAWAYGLRWRPVPVLQSYSAYTAHLDRIDAQALSSRDGPQRILRLPEPGVDGRVLPFDEPLATRAMLCRFRELRTTATSQVLGAAGDRCGAATEIATVRAGWNQTVPIPAPPNDHSFVYAEVDGVAVSGLERIRSLLYKPAVRTVTLDGSGYRLVSGTAADGLILRAPVGVDFSAPFHVAPNAATISVSKQGQAPTLGGPIVYRFFSEPVTLGPRY